jgi:parallel beta-helix repeat protein
MLKLTCLCAPLIILLGAASCNSYYIFGQSTASGIKEISQNHFVDNLGYVHVIGELQNDLTTPVDFVKVDVAYYDSQNKIVGIDFSYSDPPTISPGESATYQILTSPSNLASTDVSTIKVHYEYQMDNQSYQSGPGAQSINPTPTPATQGIVPCGLNSGAITSTGNNYTLQQDLNCSDDGLIVQFNNIIINLNGHSLIGPGPDSGKMGTVLMNSNHVIINGPGTIRNFQSGILGTESNGIDVNHVTFEGNKIAIFLKGSRNAFLVKNIINSNDIGIAAHSSAMLNINNNQISSNRLAGFTSVGSAESTISRNVIDGSANGIFFDSQSGNNVVQNNNLTDNTLDVNNADGLSLSINNNKFLGNNCNTSNPIGIC